MFRTVWFVQKLAHSRLLARVKRSLVLVGSSRSGKPVGEQRSVQRGCKACQHHALTVRSVMCALRSKPYTVYEGSRTAS